MKRAEDGVMLEIHFTPEKNLRRLKIKRHTFIEYFLTGFKNISTEPSSAAAWTGKGKCGGTLLFPNVP